MSKKRKATVGQRLEMKRAGITLGMLRQTYDATHRINAKRTDAAIKREMKKVREQAATAVDVHAAKLRNQAVTVMGPNSVSASPIVRELRMCSDALVELAKELRKAD